MNEPRISVEPVYYEDLVRISINVMKAYRELPRDEFIPIAHKFNNLLSIVIDLTSPGTINREIVSLVRSKQFQ